MCPPSSLPTNGGQDLGVLTESELRDWDHLLALGHLKEWTAETLANRFCKGQGNCPLQTYEGPPSFSLENQIIETTTGIDIEKLKLAGLLSRVAGGYGFVAWVLYNTVKAFRARRKKKPSCNYKNRPLAERMVKEMEMMEA